MKIHTYISLGVAGFLAIGAMSCSNPINPFGGTGTGSGKIDSIISSRNGGGILDTLHKLGDSLGRHGKPHDSLGGGHPHDSLGGHPPDSLGGGHGMPHDSLGGHPEDSLHGGGHGMPHDSLGGHPEDSLHHGRGGKR